MKTHWIEMKKKKEEKDPVMLAWLPLYPEESKLLQLNRGCNAFFHCGGVLVLEATRPT